MKRLIALALLLAAACLTGCGKKEADKSGQATKAKELYTFAGLKWDTPISECEAALEKATGIGFNDGYYAGFAADPGYYSVLGLPLDTAEGMDHIQVRYNWSEAAQERGEASYDNDADWVLSSISCYHQDTSLTYDAATGEIPPEELAALQDVIDDAIQKYGEPTNAYLYFNNSRIAFADYSVPAKECAYIVQDCFDFARAKGWNGFDLTLTFRNVQIDLSAKLPPEYTGSTAMQDGNYSMTLLYLPHPASENMSSFEGCAVFPWLNGKPEYTVIDP